MISKFQSIMMALCMALCLGACSESKNDEPDGPDGPTPTPTNPDIPKLTEEEASVSLAELMVRCMVLGADPKAECNDFDRLWELMETIYHQPETRGVWSGAISTFKFKQALDNSRVLYRAALLGGMVNSNQYGPEARRTIWRDIMDAPPYGEGLRKQFLPNEYRVGCDDFWKSFSLGEFDDAAVFIYTAVTSHFADSHKTSTQVVAEYLYNNNQREIDLMLTAAAPIIKEGCNVVFAAGDDLISWGQTAYDFTEKNGKVVLQACKWNLTSEAYVDAMNTNLKLLINGLEEDFFQAGDLAGVLADFTTDQIKAFNKAVQEAIDRAYGSTLSPEDVGWFVSQVQDIIGVKKEPPFLNQAYFCSDDMSQLTIEATQGHSYEFIYTDRHGNVLMEGKCAVDNKYISVSVDETSLDRSCDLLPSEGPIHGIVTIPYNIVSESTLALWWRSSNPKSKFFTIMNDELSEALFDELTLNMFVTGKMKDGSEKKVLRATKSNGAVFGKDDIATYYYGDGLWVRGAKDFVTSSGTTIRHKIEFMLGSNNIFDLSNAQRFSYSYTENDKNGKTLNWWGVFSPVIPLDQDDQEKAVWLAEESRGNMRVTNLTCRENYKTVCDQYVSNPGTNRIEINVLKGETPAQLEVSPTLLEFEAEGGEQTITVKKGNFEKFGCYWEDVFKETHTIPYDGILYWNKLIDPFHDTFQEATRATFINDSTISIFVYKNESSQPRSTKLIVWAAESYLPGLSQEELEKEDYEEVAVTIKQKGGDIKPKVANISFSGKIHLTNGKENQSCNIPIFVGTDNGDIRGSLHETNPSGSGITIRDDTIMVERRGKGIHVIGRRKEVDTAFTPNRIFELNVSFDIYDCSGDEYTAIENLEYEEIHSEKDGEVTDKLKLSAGSIPYGNNNGYMTWDDDHYLGTSWRAEQSKNTLMINSVLRYIYRDYTGTVETESYNSYTPDDNDYIGIYLYGKYLSPK